MIRVYSMNIQSEYGTTYRTNIQIKKQITRVSKASFVYASLPYPSPLFAEPNHYLDI